MQNIYVDERKLLLSSLFGGGVAGLFVDTVLFPLDTLKTRLQAAQGFKKAGGFKGVYKGILPQAVGSAPQAALFFLTYESLKHYTEPFVSKPFIPVVHLCSASVAEVVACIVRVPVEIVKQRRQTTKQSSVKIFRSALKEGVRKGLYRGFGSTVVRDLPFSAIQFPILEYIAKEYMIHINQNEPLESWEYAICGAIAGGFAAGVTTPLDVAKTRIMLADKDKIQPKDLQVRNMLKLIVRNEGVRGLFAGCIPRVLWITVGGYIFFGSYDFSKHFFDAHVL